MAEVPTHSTVQTPFEGTNGIVVKSLTTILVKHLKHCWYSFTCSHNYSNTYNQVIVLEVPEHCTAEDHLIAQIISVVESPTHLCAQTPGTLPGPWWQRFRPIPHFKYHLVAQMALWWNIWPAILLWTPRTLLVQFYMTLQAIWYFQIHPRS